MPAPYLSTTLTQAIALANIRTDMNDLDATAYRWVDATITRELDRALDRYTYVAPFYQSVQTPTVAKSRLYASPAGAWWVDRVEYPINRWPKLYQPFKERLSPLIVDPATPTVNMLLTPVAGGGSLAAGVYGYTFTFTTPGGETKPFTPRVTATATLNGTIQLSQIPTGPYGVTGRNIYRTAVGGATGLFLTALADNSTTSFIDTIADGSLGAAAPAANTTQGVPQFEMMLSSSYLPADTTGIMEITYAAKHLLDTTGTTVPEEHWDVLYLLAEAYLAEQWLGSVNDNFEWVDGQFRDKVDDTKSITAWRATYDELTNRATHRLTQIEAQINSTMSSLVRWGDKPYRYDRL